MCERYRHTKTLVICKKIFSSAGDSALLIRTSACYKYAGSTKLTTLLDHISHCKTASDTNWSNRWTYRELIINVQYSALRAGSNQGLEFRPFLRGRGEVAAMQG